MPNTRTVTWKKAIADIIKADFEPGTTIRLEELYAYEPRLKELKPNNYRVQEKIRQVIQDLRDDGLLKFTNKGEYTYTGGFEHDFGLLRSLNGSVISDYQQSQSLAVLNVSNDSILVVSVPQDGNLAESETKIGTVKVKRAWHKLRVEGQITQQQVAQIDPDQPKELTALLASLPDVTIDENGNLTQSDQSQHPVGTHQKQNSGEIVGSSIVPVGKTSEDESNLILQIKELSARNSQREERSRVSKARQLIRDTAIANALKKLYEGECQICRFTIELSGHKRYCEHHHLQAKSRGGQDIASNLLIVCPNHHTILDYNVGTVQGNGVNWTFNYQNRSEPLLLNKHLGLI